ncbi:MAG TPA: site-2 protease family protein [Acidimicrobiia bacterium]|nr:site-2 protease family protein [Acidimicrobiia bacterium]
MTGGIIVLIAFVAMIMIHEAGHFVAAKAFKMKATEFFFGFGPKLWSTQRGETEYGIKAIPLGGYVRIIGMNPYEEVDPGDVGRTYREKPFWQKSIVVLAGVGSHFVVAFLLFFTVASIIGAPVATTTVEAIQERLDSGERTPAAVAGLQPGDEIVAFEGEPVESWGGLVTVIGRHPGSTVELGLIRDGSPVFLTVTLAAIGEGDDRRGFLGVQPERFTHRQGPISGMGDAVAAIGEATVLSVEGLWRVVSGFPDLIGAIFSSDQDEIDDIIDRRPASPIGLIRIGAETSGFGLGFTLQLVALVNVFVGVFNVIPMYPLDGGHFAVALYEKIRGRPADVRKLMPVAAAVVAFLVLLGLVAIYLDISSPLRLS